MNEGGILRGTRVRAGRIDHRGILSEGDIK